VINPPPVSLEISPLQILFDDFDRCLRHTHALGGSADLIHRDQFFMIVSRLTCPPITDPVVELGSNMGEGSNASKTLYPGTNHQ